MRIVFFGTPSFAEVSLRALLDAGHDIVGVVTQPDKPQGRSRSVLVSPPVKVLAESRGLRLLQPEKPAGDVFLAALKRFKPDLGVVVAYGHILRQQVLDIPRLGMINVHASLLPKLRGAAPIQWALAGGETETGVSIMRMEAGLDSGPVYSQSRTPIERGDTGGSLTVRLADLGAQSLVELLPAIARGSARPVPQDHAAATQAPKLTREAALIDWTADAESIARRICAFDPVPGAWTRLGLTDVKLFNARTAPGAGEPGEVLRTGERILVAAGEGAVEVGEVQPAGRRRSGAGEWTRGRGVAERQRFE